MSVSLGGRVERDFECFVCVFNECEFEAFFGFFGDFGQILLVSSGQNDGLYAGLLGGEDFLLQAANGQNRPRSVISPVIATSGLVGFCSRRLTSEVNIATPALGPSLGIAPAGT